MSFLKADYRIVCYGAEHETIKAVAILAVCLYPVGIPLMYLLLLIAARRAIIEERPTRLSTALSLLHRDFVKRLYWCESTCQLELPPPTHTPHLHTRLTPRFTPTPHLHASLAHALPPRLIPTPRWEIANQLEKLWLVGFMTLIANDTIVQLGIAMAVSLTFMLISSVAAPFRRKEDTYFAVACHFSLTATFFFCAMLKVKVLVDEVEDNLSEQLRDRFDFDEVLCSATLVVLPYYG